MPNAEMKKWRISQIQFDLEVLEKGSNELEMSFAFSSMVPENSTTENNIRVKFEFQSKNKEGKNFLSLTSDSYYEVSSPEMLAHNKKELLDNECFPETYKIVCDFLENFMKMVHLPPMLLPDYADLK